MLFEKVCFLPNVSLGRTRSIHYRHVIAPLFGQPMAMHALHAMFPAGSVAQAAVFLKQFNVKHLSQSQ